jgi:predicted site-specific integrase-resolvase
MSDTADVLKPQAAAQLLQISPNTLRHWSREGKIPCLYTGVYRYSRIALLNAMSNVRQQEKVRESVGQSHSNNTQQVTKPYKTRLSKQRRESLESGLREL